MFCVSPVYLGMMEEAMMSHHHTVLREERTKGGSWVLGASPESYLLLGTSSTERASPERSEKLDLVSVQVSPYVRAVHAAFLYPKQGK